MSKKKGSAKAKANAGEKKGGLGGLFGGNKNDFA